MLNFDNIEALVSYMFEKLDDENHLVSTISNKEMAIEIMHELLNYNNVILNSCNIDDICDYEKEYLITLYDDTDSDNWYVNVEKSYLKEKNRYIGIDGYVLFHGAVNSRVMIDMQNNELMPLDKYDLFVIAESDEAEPKEHSYIVNGESVDKETFDEYVSKFAPNQVDKKDNTSNKEDYSICVKCNLDAYEVSEIIRDMEHRMMHVNDMFHEMDCFRRLFNW